MKVPRPRLPARHKTPVQVVVRYEIIYFERSKYTMPRR